MGKCTETRKTRDIVIEMNVRQEAIHDKVESIYKVIYGNKKDGLITQVSKNSGFRKHATWIFGSIFIASIIVLIKIVIGE